MKAEIKRFSMVDEEFDSYWPEDCRFFGVGMDVTIGPIDFDGGDNFSFLVCTPMWYEKNGLGSGGLIRHVLFVPEYDEGNIKRIVNEMIEKSTGSDWTEISKKLARYLFWEFEDYYVIPTS